MMLSNSVGGGRIAVGFLWRGVLQGMVYGAFYATLFATILMGFSINLFICYFCVGGVFIGGIIGAINAFVISALTYYFYRGKLAGRNYRYVVLIAALLTTFSASILMIGYVNTFYAVTSENMYLKPVTLIGAGLATFASIFAGQSVATWYIELQYDYLDGDNG
jgi:hypothetical protein